MDDRITEILNILEIDNNVLTEEELGYLTAYIHNIEKEIKTIKDKIKDETTSHCNECKNKECCPEEECVLYRIECLTDKRG